jgi:hypothetical protein
VRSKDAIFGLVAPVGGVDGTETAARIDCPDVRDPELEVIVDFFLKIARTIVSGKNFDNEERWRGEDLLVWFLEVYADVRNAKASLFYLDSLLGEAESSQLILEGNKKADEFSLQPAMVSFSQIALHDDTIDVLAVAIWKAGV